MYIRKLVSSDAADVSVLHTVAFNNFFLTSLGGKFLKVFYEAILKSNEGIGVGIFEDNNLKGFAIGTIQIAGYYRSLAKRHMIKFVICALPFILNFSVLKSLIISLKNNNQGLEGCCLLSICVDPFIERKGLGSILLNSFENEVRTLGIYKYSLTTDRNNNDKANIFYENRAFSLVNVLHMPNRELNVYSKELI